MGFHEFVCLTRSKLCPKRVSSNLLAICHILYTITMITNPLCKTVGQRFKRCGTIEHKTQFSFIILNLTELTQRK